MTTRYARATEDTEENQEENRKGKIMTGQIADPKQQIDLIMDYLGRCPFIRFAYLFGSHARGDAGRLSDIDLAVFIHEGLDAFRCRLQLMEQVAGVLRHDHFDLVVLNDAPLTLRYEVVREGRVLKEDKARRVEFETGVLRHYLDTVGLRQTQQAYLKEQLLREGKHG